MFKNIFIKKLLKESVFRLVSYTNRIIPKRDDYILLYSGNKGINFNLKPLKEYLKQNGYDKKNTIICGIENMQYAENDGCIYITHFNAIFYFLRSKHVFYTAGQLPIKPSRSQCVIHLHHGITFKTCGAMSKINNGNEFYFSYCVGTSDLYKSIYKTAYCCEESNVIVNSEPVTDVFFRNYTKYDLGAFDKIILWAPTFRQSDYLGYDDSQEDLLPAFKEDDYEELNRFLKELDYRLIVKIHPSQDLSKYKQLRFSNLEILSNADFEKMGFDLYNLLPQIDLLLADYSSLFLQFLLLDKPIAFVVPDMEEYSLKRGFAFSDPESYMPGAKIQSKEEFYSFLRSFHAGIDEYADARLRVKNLIHKYSDGKSCERLIQMSGIEVHSQ